MQNSKVNKKPETKIKIRFGIGKSLILLFSGLNNLLWIKENIFDLLNGKEGVPVKSSHYTTVLKFQNQKTGEIFYFKEFHDRCIKDKINKFFRRIRSKRAFRAGQLLLKNGFFTPLPVVYGTEKIFCFIKKNFLITKEVSGERTYQYFQKYFQPSFSAELLAEKRALMYAAGHEIGRLHRMGIFHGDLRVGNIIINGKGSSAQFFFIDNERTRQYRVIPERKRVKNLVQLNMVLLPQITRTDRLRFFNTYIAENPMLSAQKKSIIRTILRITKKRHDNKLLR